MSATSKKYFEENFKQKIWKGLIGEINGVKSEKEITKVLSKILTPPELNLLEKRLVVISLLNQRLSYRQIAEIADVRPGTISFIKKGLKKERGVPKTYSPMTHQIKKGRPILPPRGKGRWRFLNQL